jgi:ATP-dependent protease ClpP protease subunit
MGAIILQAADHRQAYPNAEIMLHDGETGYSGHARDLERYAKENARNRERMYRLLAKRSGQPAAHFRRKLAFDWFLTPKEALKEGLLDEVLLVP